MGLKAKPLSISTPDLSQVLKSAAKGRVSPHCGSEPGLTAADQHTVFYQRVGSITKELQ